MALFTVGHGALSADELTALLTAAGVELVVDVRAHPGSRRHPHFTREAMSSWLTVGYRWEPRLGGKRRPVAGSPNVGLDEPFRAYADHMATADFRSAVDEVLASPVPTAVLCAESRWTQCHRQLVADHAVLVDGVEVVHLLHDGGLEPHVPTPSARVEADRLVYDVGVERPLL